VKGKCRSCRTKIDFQYVRVELKGVFIFALCFLFWWLANIIITGIDVHGYEKHHHTPIAGNSLEIMTQEPIRNILFLIGSPLPLIVAQGIMVCWVAFAVLFNPPIHIFRVLIKLFYLIAAIILYLLISLFICFCIAPIIQGSGIDAKHFDNIFFVSSSTINSIIGILYFGLFLRRFYRDYTHCT
jgi:hypothetical protein